jgi:hypothetical protein
MSWAILEIPVRPPTLFAHSAGRLSNAFSALKALE